MWQGGDYFQLNETVKALRKKGVEVEVNDQLIYTPAIQYRNFDVVHAWNFSMAWTPFHLGLAFTYHKPTVCSMIYHDKDEFVSWENQRLMADKLDKAIFLNEGEVQRFKNKLKIDDSKVAIIGNGITKDWFKPKTHNLGYVLTTGRIEAHKGQLEVAQACKEIGAKYIMVGQAHDKEYLEKCLEAGAIHHDGMPQGDLKKVYADCGCLVLNSKAEVQPLVVMEAGAMAKNIVLAKGCLWKAPNVYWVDCGDVEQLKTAIQLALIAPPNEELRDYLKTQNWEMVADRLIEIYKQVIDKKKNEPYFEWQVDPLLNENAKKN